MYVRYYPNVTLKFAYVTHDDYPKFLISKERSGLMGGTTSQFKGEGEMKKNSLILSLGLLLIVLCSASTATYASQPSVNIEGKLDQKLVEAAKALRPDDKLSVWIDLNMTEDVAGNHYLPADPSLYGIKHKIITFATDNEESRLVWCLTDIQTRQVQMLPTVPWIFSMRLAETGDLNQSANPKLGLGFQEAIERATECGGSLRVIVWMNYPSSSDKVSSNNEQVENAIVESTKSTIVQFGGKLVEEHYKGCRSLSAAIPARRIAQLAESPLVKELLLDGPVIPEGIDNTERLYGSAKAGDKVSYCALFSIAFLSLAVSVSVASAKKKVRRKELALMVVAMVSALVLMTQVNPTYALDISTGAINATNVWATGNTGQGVNIAVIDVGFDINHNDLAPAIVARINAHDWTNNVGGNEDHGTHVAGIVAGRGVNNINFRGVAWGAGLVLVKIEADADYEPAIRWVINNRAQFNIRAITMSLYLVNTPAGGDGLESPASIAMDDAVENGIVTIKSAGNIGHQGARTVTSPGNAFNIITVGAVNDRDTANVNDDEFALYPNGYVYKGITYRAWGSSRGPTGDG